MWSCQTGWFYTLSDFKSSYLPFWGKLETLDVCIRMDKGGYEAKCQTYQGKLNGRWAGPISDQMWIPRTFTSIVCPIYSRPFLNDCPSFGLCLSFIPFSSSTIFAIFLFQFLFQWPWHGLDARLYSRSEISPRSRLWKARLNRKSVAALHSLLL